MPTGIAVINVAGTLPPGYCWTTPQQYYEDIIALLSSVLPGTFNGFNFGNTVPAPADQDKPWIRTDSSGRFDKIYTYSGGWLSPHPVPTGGLSLMIWKGTEANLWAFDGGDGTDPVVSPPTATTGAMWVRDTDFDFKVPMGMGTNSVSYGGVFTSLALGALLGEEQHALTIAELAAHTHETPCLTVLAGGAYTVSAGASVTGTNVTSTSTGSGTAHQNLPPVRGVIFAKRSARVYYTI